MWRFEGWFSLSLSRGGGGDGFWEWGCCGEVEVGMGTRLGVGEMLVWYAGNEWGRS